MFVTYTYTHTPETKYVELDKKKCDQMNQRWIWNGYKTQNSPIPIEQANKMKKTNVRQKNERKKLTQKIERV